MKRLVVIITLILPVAPLSADPWILPRGQSYARLYATYGSTDEYYNDNSDDFRLAGDLNMLKVAANYNVGVRDNLGLSLEIPYTRWEREFPGNTNVNSGIGDSRLDLKYLVVKQDLYAVSLLAGVKVPGSYEENRINAPGDGNVDVPIGISVGGIYQQFFWDIDFLYRFRSQEPDDEIEFMIDGGIRLNENLLAKIHFNKVDSFGGKGINDAVFSYEELEEDYDRLGFTIDIMPDRKWDVFLDYTYTLNGRNTPDADYLTTGLGIAF